MFLFRCIPTYITKRIDHVLDAISSLLDVIEDNLVEVKLALDTQRDRYMIYLVKIPMKPSQKNCPQMQERNNCNKYSANKYVYKTIKLQVLVNV